MPDTGNAKDCLELSPTNFSIFTVIIKRDLTNLFDQFHSTVLYSILFRFVCIAALFTHLISSNLSCNLCLRCYDQLVHSDKEIHANVYRHSLQEYSKCFHCSFEWHLTPHMTFSIETCIRRTPCIKRTLQYSPRVSAKYRFHSTLQLLVLESRGK